MEKKKVSFTFWLPEGKTATVKADNYELLLQEIDRFFDVFKENVSYYLGYNDEEVIRQAIEDEDIDVEMGDAN